jgi:predicted nucleic acid-binding protein
VIALDTNIFIYLFDETDQRKQAIADALVRRSLQERSAQISYQVVQETLSALGTRLPIPSTPEHSRAFLEES